MCQSLKADQMQKDTSLHIIIWVSFKPKLYLLVSHTSGGPYTHISPHLLSVSE